MVQLLFNKRVCTEVGGFVKQDEVVAIIETDKVNIDINAPNSGVLLETYANAGDSVTVGQKLFKLKLTDAGTIFNL